MSIVGTLAQKIYEIRIEHGLVDPKKVEEDIANQLSVKDSIKMGRTLEEKNLRRCLPDGLSVVLGRKQIQQLIDERCPQYALSKAPGCDEMLGLPLVRVDKESYLAVEVRQETLDRVFDANEAYDLAMAEEYGTEEEECPLC